MIGAEHTFAVSASALDDAAQTLRDKCDVLLDRITDRLLGMPPPGSPEWHNIFRSHPTADAYRQRRTEVRAALAHRAGVNVAVGFTVNPIHKRRPPTRRLTDEAQLSIW